MSYINYSKSHVFQTLSCLSIVITAIVVVAEPLKAQVPIATPTLSQEQTQAPVIQPRQRDTKPPSSQPLPELPITPLPPPDQLLPPPSNTSPTQPEAPSEDVPQTITISKFNVTGSTVFSAEDFGKITNKYTKRPISIAELFQIRSEITKLYVDKGYITSGAYIPPQKLQDGVIEIRVLEGTLEEIKVNGTRRLKPGYVRSRLEIATRKPLNRDRLLEALQILQLNPLIQNLSAELAAGTSPGSSTLEVQIRESKPLIRSSFSITDVRQVWAVFAVRYKLAKQIYWDLVTVSVYLIPILTVVMLTILTIHCQLVRVTGHFR